MEFLWTGESTSVTTVRQVLKNYGAKSIHTIDHLHLDYAHEIKPNSLVKQPRPNERKPFKFANRINTATSAFKSFAVVPEYMFEDRRANVVIAHCEMIGELVHAGEWRSQCVITMWMSEDGMKVLRWSEFMDSIQAKMLDEILLGIRVKEAIAGVVAAEDAASRGLPLIEEKQGQVSQPVAEIKSDAMSA